MTKGTVTTDIVYLPINEVSWLVSRNNNNNNLNRGIPRVPLQKCFFQMVGMVQDSVTQKKMKKKNFEKFLRNFLNFIHEYHFLCNILPKHL